MSTALAFSYQVTLVETGKPVENAARLRTELKRQFLERYFGTNKFVQEFAVEALKANRRDVAKKVNRAVKLLGSPVGNAASFLSGVSSATRWSANRRRFSALVATAKLRSADRSRRERLELQLLLSIGMAVLAVLGFAAILANHFG